MNCPVGIRSLAVRFPNVIRTNDYWRERTPELVNPPKRRRTRTHQPIDSAASASGLEIWSQAVSPYLSDPFRGSVERRVLDQHESSFTLEYSVAQDAIAAANLTSADIDLLILTSIFPEQIGLRDVSYLAERLSLLGPAWNLESTCSSAVIALQTAVALIRAQEYQKVLVVVSHVGSNAIDLTDTLSWSLGDGAGAFIVSTLKSGQGLLGAKIVNTAATRGAHVYDWVVDAAPPRLYLRTGENASALAETAVDYVRTCCEGAAAAAGVTLDQVDFFVFNTPTAWYASVCTRALGIDPERTINLYPRYANIGPVFPIANLYHAALADKIRENDLILIYTNGASATAGAVAARWGDVALGPVPAPALSVTPKQERIHLAGVESCSKDESSISQAGNLSREQLLAAEPAQRQLMLETYLLGWLTSSLQLPPAELTSQQPFASLLDSLMALMFRSRIESDLQLRAPMEKFFGDNTIAQLAEHLLSQLTLTTLVLSENAATATNEKEGREILNL